jgi:hypothetical protein
MVRTGDYPNANSAIEQILLAEKSRLEKQSAEKR